MPYMSMRCAANDRASPARKTSIRRMKLGSRLSHGPFELLDFVASHDRSIAEIMFEEFRRPRFARPSLLRRHVLAGHLGRKSGRGFYDYR